MKKYENGQSERQSPLSGDLGVNPGGKAGGRQREILSKHFDTNSEKCGDRDCPGWRRSDMNNGELRSRKRSDPGWKC